MISVELPLHVESHDLQALIGDTPWRSALVRVSPLLVPRGGYTLVRVQASEDGVAIGETVVHSLDLARHLKGVEHAAVMAVTLGGQVEAEINQAPPDEAVVLDAIASAAAEGAIEELGALIARRHPELGMLGPRYSPGYGDWKISGHAAFGELLKLSELGLSILSSGALVPRKSVTAVAGFGGEGRVPSCQSCPVRNCKTPCRFRRT